MKIILTKDVEALGGEGEIVDVKDGYARNYLLPQNMAVTASAGNLKTWENEKKARDRRIAKNLESAKKQAQMFETMTIEIPAKTGEEGKLYGSVTAQDISNALSEKSKMEIDRRKLVLSEPIKTAGEHKVVYRVYQDVKAEITVKVVPETV